MDIPSTNSAEMTADMQTRVTGIGLWLKATLFKKMQAAPNQYKSLTLDNTHIMAYRINAIDNEILNCIGQLQSISPECVNDEYFETLLNAEGRSLAPGQVRPPAFRRQPRTVPPPQPPRPTKPAQTAIVKSTGFIQGDPSNGYTVNISGYDVPLLFKYEQKDQVTTVAQLNDAPKFSAWCKSIHTGSAFTTQNITIYDIVMFGPKVGFVTADVNIKHDESNTIIPGIVFIRGHSVGILLALHCDDGEIYTVMTKQARTATGVMDFEEIPAGMMDSSGDFTGKAIEELKQETGIIIQTSELIELTHTSSNGLYLSPGGCDEAMKLFLFSAKITKAGLAKINGKLTGEAHEGEKIELVVRTLDHIKTIPDMKTVCAYNLYKNMNLQGRNIYTCQTPNKYVEIK
jgi:ADP-sugar diphosphatase